MLMDACLILVRLSMMSVSPKCRIVNSSSDSDSSRTDRAHDGLGRLTRAADLGIAIGVSLIVRRDRAVNQESSRSSG